MCPRVSVAVRHVEYASDGVSISVCVHVCVAVRHVECASDGVY